MNGCPQRRRPHSHSTSSSSDGPNPWSISQTRSLISRKSAWFAASSSTAILAFPPASLPHWIALQLVTFGTGYLRVPRGGHPSNGGRTLREREVGVGRSRGELVRRKHVA